MPTPALVVLDLGGVLIEWDPVAAVAAGVGRAEAERLMAGFDFGAWNHAHDAGRPHAEGLALAEREAPHWVPHLKAYVAHFPRSLTGPMTEQVQLLEELDDAGVRLWALTNWSRETFHHARERFDFLDRFEEILVSGELGVAKPDPRIFEMLLAKAALPAEEVLFVDDRRDNVEAARGLGIDALAFTDAQTLRAELRRRGLPG